MPIHEFKCDKCDVTTETNIPGWREGQAPNCHRCNEKMRKLFSIPAAPRFNGSGFYETDYKEKQ